MQTFIALVLEVSGMEMCTLVPGTMLSPARGYLNELTRLNSCINPRALYERLQHQISQILASTEHGVALPKKINFLAVDFVY